jgi:hypothetical protein
VGTTRPYLTDALVVLLARSMATDRAGVSVRIHSDSA